MRQPPSEPSSQMSSLCHHQCQSWVLDLAGFGRGFCGVVKVVAKWAGSVGLAQTYNPFRIGKGTLCPSHPIVRYGLDCGLSPY